MIGKMGGEAALIVMMFEVGGTVSGREARSCLVGVASLETQQCKG